jgi:hypothetical protein
VFDTGYSKIIPMTATATSNTQSVVTFAIPTSGYVAVGGPMAGPAATILTTTTGDAPYYGARAWVNFNGTGTVAIRASSNVSSITDLGTGLYDVNFASVMPDANYTVPVGGSLDSFSLNASYGIGVYNFRTTAVSLACRTEANAYNDFQFVTATVFR